MHHTTPSLSIDDPETLYAFYTWAIWHLEPKAWILFYKPTSADWKRYAREIYPESIENCIGFYEWAEQWTDRYQPLDDHLDRFFAMWN